MQVEAPRSSLLSSLEVVECARLIKGYGDTWKPGAQIMRRFSRACIMRVFEGRLPVATIEGIASARTAALADPEGESLAKLIAAIEAQAEMRQAAE